MWKKFFRAYLLGSLFIGLLFSFSHANAVRCIDVFEIPFVLQKQEGFNSDLGRKMSQGPFLDYLILNKKQEPVGEVAGEFKADTKTGRLHFMIPDQFKGLSISRQFLRIYFQRFGRDLIFQDVLVLDNFEAFEAARANGMNEFDATNATPYAKIMKNQGFVLQSARVDYEREMIRVLFVPEAMFSQSQ